MKKGMMCQILRSCNDCSNGGLSSRFDNVVLTGYGVAEIFEPSYKMPEVELVRKNYNGREYVYALPVEPEGAEFTCWMFGGAFIYDSDSRFISKQPIKLHDRKE
jgi:hypothetical protein